MKISIISHCTKDRHTRLDELYIRKENNGIVQKTIISSPNVHYDHTADSCALDLGTCNTGFILGLRLPLHWMLLGVAQAIADAPSLCLMAGWECGVNALLLLCRLFGRLVDPPPVAPPSQAPPPPPPP